MVSPARVLRVVGAAADPQKQDSDLDAARGLGRRRGRGPLKGQSRSQSRCSAAAQSSQLARERTWLFCGKISREDTELNFLSFPRVTKCYSSFDFPPVELAPGPRAPHGQAVGDGPLALRGGGRVMA